MLPWRLSQQLVVDVCLCWQRIEYLQCQQQRESQQQQRRQREWRACLILPKRIRRETSQTK
jgi:hypothetical protein